MNHTKRLLTILAIASVSGVGVWLALQVEPQEESGSGRVQANRAEPTEPPPPAEAPTIRAPEAVESRTLAADPAPSSDDPPAAAASGLFGKVIDAATEAPIEGIIVTIGKRKDLTEVTTDEHGAFHFDASLGRRRFGLQLLSGARVSFGKRLRRVTPEDLPLVLRATIGPLYRIEIVGPEDVQELEWSAHLEQRGEGGASLPRNAGQTPPQPLSPGSPHEVRFPAPISAGGNSTTYLALHEPSGVWRGEVIAPTLVGEYPDVIQIVVSKFGTLRGRVVEPPETPLTSATVHLMGAKGLPWPPIEGPWSHASTTESGTFEFQGLVPGDYFLMVAPPHFPMIQRRLTIPEGVLDIGAITVPGGGAKGKVSGVLKSATGRGSMCAMLQIESTDGTGWASALLVGTPTELLKLFYNGAGSSAPGPETELTFEFKDVPSGNYRLTVIPWDGRRYEPMDIDLRAPTDRIAITRRDALDEIGFAFEVSDEETGALLPTFMAHFHTSRWAKEKSFPRGSGEVLGRIAPDGDLSWAVFADGYVPVWGDASAFADGGDPCVHQVALKRGWGAQFTVRDGRDPRRHHDRAASKLIASPLGEAPLSGVRVLADGALVATTDSQGRALILLSTKPKRLDFVRPGWIVTPTTTFRDGQVLHDSPNPKIWMVPAPK